MSCLEWVKNETLSSFTFKYFKLLNLLWFYDLKENLSFFFFFVFFLSVFWSYSLFLGKLIIPPYLCSLPIIITLNLSFCLAHTGLSGHFKSTYLLFWSHLCTCIQSKMFTVLVVCLWHYISYAIALSLLLYMRGCSVFVLWELPPRTFWRWQCWYWYNLWGMNWGNLILQLVFLFYYDRLFCVWIIVSVYIWGVHAISWGNSNNRNMNASYFWLSWGYFFVYVTWINFFLSFFSFFFLF